MFHFGVNWQSTQGNRNSIQIVVRIAWPASAGRPKAAVRLYRAGMATPEPERP
jgi:hypothetical protein